MSNYRAQFDPMNEPEMTIGDVAIVLAASAAALILAALLIMQLR